MLDGPPAATTSGWGTPTFQENFNGTSLNTAIWGVYDHPEADPPRSAAAVSVANGHMTITGGVDDTGHDVSGGIGSNINLMYGRWEVRFRVDKGSGYSAVALLWPQRDSDWPSAGEIDFSEINQGSRSISNMFVHNGPDNSQRDDTVRVDFTKWHTVAVEWTPNHVAFYLDGKRQHFMVTSKNDPHMVPTMEPMHLALQLDQGCDDWIPCRDSSTPPKVRMQVDWVKIYALAP